MMTKGLAAIGALAMFLAVGMAFKAGIVLEAASALHKAGHPALFEALLGFGLILAALAAIMAPIGFLFAAADN